MTKLLEKEGHSVLTAPDGLAALEILEGHVPNVAFIDLVMPNISGDKLCQIIRSMPELKDLRLVIHSAIAAEEATDFAAFGADACIAKGPLNETAKHVLSALEQTESERASGRPGKIAGFDGLRLREISKELISVKKHLEVVLMSMPEGILEINESGRIIFANQSAVLLLDIPEGRLLGLRFTELFKEDDRKKIQDFLAERNMAPEATWKETPLLANGREIAMNCFPFVKGEDNNMIVAFKDISKEKRMEAQLRQAQKMEAIGTLAGGIAHDFNNLLMTIQGNVSLMLLQADSTHPYHQRLKNIEKQVESGARLTGQLLGYARKGRYEIKPTNVNWLVEQTADTFSRTKKEITIHRELAEDLFAIEADEGQIEQLLLNLLVNAADAMPGGGHLTLKTRNATDRDIGDKPYDIKSGGYVLITVTDTGTGMDKKTRERLFEPFFTTKEMGRGTGLGLASVYGIVKSHAGYIDVTSDKGHGTTFRVFLPSSSTLPPPALTEKGEKTIPGTGTILLVDDEADVLQMEAALLKELGYAVIEATSGAQAIRTYKAEQHTIDLVILDMIMPEISGGDVYDALKQMNPSVKALLATGYSIEGQATLILERGCDGFIQKPFDLASISQSIGQILNEK
jgi:PAS domain S-box-containing protein